MPQTVQVHLMFPSQDTHRVVKRRVALNGRYRDERAQIDVPLHPNMSTNGGKEIWIDAEKGVQVQYRGLTGWVGVDGRYTFAAQIKKDAQDLQTRGFDFSKYVWPIIIFVLGVMGALVAALAFSVGK